jgi:ubiquinone/menaquinone biosynthesis C-methylase UbiE
MLPDISKFTSRDELTRLIKPGAICVELGVAEGKFSEKLLRKSSLGHLYSIDMYAGDRGHDDKQYEYAQRLLNPYKERNSLIRKTFAEALLMFHDEYFDLIYIDGYAHTGQDDGATMRNWYPKLKKGGIISGDDYSEKYPKTVEQVEKFILMNGLKLQIISDWNGHHTWLAMKP